MARCKAIVATLSVLVLVTLLAGPLAAQDFRVAYGSEPTSLDPQLVTDGGERLINENIYETLLRRGTDGTLGPGLAEELPRNIAPTVWQLKIRRGIKFHNGEPLNAASVAYSFNRIINPEFKTRQRFESAAIAGAEAVDDYTVNIRTHQPDPALPVRLYYLKMVPMQAAQKPRFAEEPVGTGPYRFVEWVKGARVVLEANKDYWGGAPSVPRVVYRFVPDASVRVAGLIAGDFDLINNLPPEDFARVPQAIRTDGLFVNFILPNALGGITKDGRVRQALDLAIDKQALASSLYERHATVAAGQFITKHTFGFNPALQARPYDPSKARQLLREAGAEGAAIELVSTAGRWLKDRETTEAVAAYWTQVGLKVNVRMYEFREYLNRLLDRNVRPAAIFVSAADVLLDADRMVSSYLLKGQQFASSADDAMSALIPQARTELNASRRQALYNEVLRRAQEETYIISLLNYEDIYGLSKRTVWTPRPDGQVLIKNVTLR